MLCIFVKTRWTDKRTNSNYYIIMLLIWIKNTGKQAIKQNKQTKTNKKKRKKKEKGIREKRKDRQKRQCTRLNVLQSIKF